MVLMEDESSRKKLRNRTFTAGDAINTSTNYYIPWADSGELLREITDHSRWLLITGPCQSGKSSLMFKLADACEAKGFHAVVMTLSSQMVTEVNDAPSDSAAAQVFCRLLAARLESHSRGALKQGRSPGMQGVTEMFQGSSHKEEFIWFIDEASLLNDMKRISVVQAFLSELRTMKRECISRQRTGTYYLRSFVLVGTPKLKQLIGDLRVQRVEKEGIDDYKPSPPAPWKWDPNDPFGSSVSPLSMERSRQSDCLGVMDIVELLSQYTSEHEDVVFCLEDGADSQAAAIRKFAKSIWGLTSGHKGLVGTCCEYLARNSIYNYRAWMKQVRFGHVSRYAFYNKAYSRVVSNIVTYSKEARNVILRCIETGLGVAVNDLYDVLRPLNDGVLEQVDVATVALTSGLLLSAFLEDCSFSPLEALPEMNTFVEAVESAFTFIKYECLTRAEVLNANGQPSEYVWQCEFLLALKFVLQEGYKAAYKIIVEAKRRDKHGQRRTRLDLLLKNGSGAKGFELQGAEAGKAGEMLIKKHIKKSAVYGELHECEMHYVYFQYGDYGTDAKAIIEEESQTVPQVNCWFVQYLPGAYQWNIAQLVRGSGWRSLQKDAATNFPKFQFQKRTLI